MNMDYDTAATAYGIAAFAAWLLFMTCGMTVFISSLKAAKRWMRRVGKPYAYEVWFDRCLLVYAFLFMFSTQGFSLMSKIMAVFVLIHLAVDNPWMIRHIERVRAEKRKGSK